jgi:hypothetical protein
VGKRLDREERVTPVNEWARRHLEYSLGIPEPDRFSQLFLETILSRFEPQLAAFFRLPRESKDRAWAREVVALWQLDDRAWIDELLEAECKVRRASLRRSLTLKRNAARVSRLPVRGWQSAVRFIQMRQAYYIIAATREQYQRYVLEHSLNQADCRRVTTVAEICGLWPAPGVEFVFLENWMENKPPEFVRRALLIKRERSRLEVLDEVWTLPNQSCQRRKKAARVIASESPLA